MDFSMYFQVLPLSWDFKFLTFSKKRIGGFFVSTIFKIQSNKLPCSRSSKPCYLPSEFFLDTPAREKGWQGKPAHKISCEGIELWSIVLISSEVVFSDPYQCL